MRSLHFIRVHHQRSRPENPQIHNPTEFQLPLPIRAFVLRERHPFCVCGVTGKAQREKMLAIIGTMIPHLGLYL